MKIATQSLIILLSVTLTSCAWFKPNPYANFSVGDVDEDGPDTEATILVGDPQVISRETLINDRLRESEHIDDLLKESRTLKFEPQIFRDIKVVNAFASQLGVSFDPSIGSAFNRQEGIADISTEIEMLKLRNQLNQLQQLVNTDPSNQLLNPTTKEPKETDPTQNQATKPNTDALTSTAKEKEGTLIKLNAVVNTLLSTAADKLQEKARGSQLSSSPEEHFEDLNAYRARLRQRQAEINLDDVHDTVGNTLYRLQLNATVLPGEIKNKYGVLDFAVTGSEVSERDLILTYANWISALNIRYKNMEKEPSTNPNKQEWDQMIDFFEDKEYVRRCEYEKEEEGKSWPMIVFLSPENDLKASLDNGDQSISQVSTQTNINQIILRRAIFDRYKSSKIRALLLKPLEILKSKQQYKNYQFELAKMKPGESDQSKKSYQYKVQQVNKAKEELNKYKEETSDSLSATCSATSNYPPPNFITAMTIRGDNNKLYWKDDHVYTYQAQPTEKVQRLSSLASAANSMQSAFALAATLPQYGVAIDAGAAAARAAVGLVDAIERIPLVIGYTDTGRISTKEKRKPHFGYIFGPKAILQSDENQLVYKQVPASHSVFADISVPSWWSSLTLQTKSVWAGNWHNGAKILKSYNKSHEIEVRLRPGPQGFYNLTNYLYSNTIPLGNAEEATIDEILPNTVSVCARGEVDFSIKGNNLWRNPKVFFLGQQQPQQNVKVLPDMSGLLVKVNVNRLPLDPTLFKNKNEIVVWTKFGQARAIKPNNIKFTGSIEECSSITNPELKPEKNAYVVNNSAGTNEFIVHVTSKIPDAMQSCQVIVQMIPRNESLPREIIASSDTERFGTSSYKGAINLNKSNSHIGQDAEIFRVGLRCQFSEISNPKPIWSIINAVLYPDAASKKIKITKNKVTKLSSNEIELTLPNKFNLAYPGFLKTGKFKLTVIKHPEVTISGDLPASAASEKKVNLSLGFTKGDSEKDKAFNKAWCDENLNATLSIPSIENVDIPTIKDAAIKLIKKTEGCI